MRITFFLLVLSTTVAFTLGQTTCYSTNERESRDYGSLSDYESQFRIVEDSLEESQCTTLGMYFLGRGGSNYPDKATLEDMKKYLPEIQARIADPNNKDHTLCPEDVEGIKNWRSRYVEQQATFMGKTGEKEQCTIGERFKKRLPTLFNTTYDYEKFTFGVNNYDPRQQNLLDSYSYISRCLLGGGINDSSLLTKISPSFYQSDRDYLECDNWKKHVKNVPIKELVNFDKSDTMKGILDSVTKRFGLQKPLDMPALLTLYKMCAYDYIIFGVPKKKEPLPRGSEGSPWCAAFTYDEIVALEYRSDIIDYYLASYGNDLNAQTTCFYTKLIAEYLRATMDDPSNTQNGIFHYVKPYALLNMMTLLGLDKDGDNFTPLKGSNYNPAVLADRQFKTSRMIPFSASLGFVSYKCGNDFKFKLLANEGHTKFKSCDYDELCDIDELLTSEFGNCDYDSICGGPYTGDAGSHSLSQMLLLTCVAYVITGLQ